MLSAQRLHFSTLTLYRALLLLKFHDAQTSPLRGEKAQSGAQAAHKECQEVAAMHR